MPTDLHGGGQFVLALPLFLIYTHDLPVLRNISTMFDIKTKLLNMPNVVLNPIDHLYLNNSVSSRNPDYSLTSP